VSSLDQVVATGTPDAMPLQQRSEMLRLFRASAQRLTLGLLLGAITSVAVDVGSDLAKHNPALHWVVMAALLLELVGAAVSLKRWKGAENHPAVREFLEHRGSAIRITSSDRSIRIILASGSELRFAASATDLRSALEILREHSPEADFASHDS